MIIRKVKVTEYEYQAPINYVAGATEPDIQFQLTDYEIPSGATGRVYVGRSNGTFEYTVATISGNNVTVAPTSSMFSVKGPGAIQVTLYVGNEVVKNFAVPVYVHADLADDSAEAGSDVTGVFRAAEEEALADFQEQAEEIAEEVKESIPEDYTELTEEVEQLNERIDYVKQDIVNADLYDLRRDLNYYDADWNGITFTWNKAQNTCTIAGTATAVTYNNLFISQNSLPTNIQAGDVLRVKYKATNVSLIFYDYSGGNLTLLKEVKRDTIVKIPNTCTGLIIRLWIGNGTTVNETVAPEIYKNANCIIESVDTASESETGKTDMRYIIQEMLDIYGYCKLSPGAFYISGVINMPEGGTLEGCGESTQIYLTSGNSKAAIQLRRYGAVRNLSLIGSYTDLAESDFGASAGSRYGIQYYKGSSDPWIPAYCSISNVHIRNFTAAGIYQYGTGANVEQGLFVSDVHIKNCWCGIWIYSNSEFCRYNNVQITYCYIACINNGGNNSFSNCVFHAYTIGMKIDGTQNNAAHGMCSNSSFCHIGNNLGSAVTLSDIVHGYVFSACQYWYNSIDIVNCGGIVFNGCEFGRGTTNKGATINITNGDTVMFGNCVFMNDVTYRPDITVTNNNKVKFTGCYGSVSGNEISA